MPDNPRVQELLDELLDRDATPEEVCNGCPELLPVVRERWRQISRARAELDVMFPVSPSGTLPAMPHEDMPLPQIPGYEFDAVLGRGGMGVVFRARHLRLGRHVALKMTLTGSYAGPHERERFRREAEAIAALRHANVVQVYDVGDWAGRPYFTMELIEGGSLAQRLAGVPQPARQAATIMVTLAEAMHAAHEGGIVHRDLKPANVLFMRDGTPKVTDFGLARRLEGDAGLTVSGSPLGTPSYMAPEQARGQSRAIGPAVDVYALGAILYELLTGRPPFCGETQAETILQVIDQEPVPPTRLNAKVHRDLEVICLKCLQKEPSRRYLSATALAEDLRRFLDGESIEARPEGPLERLARRMRRRPGFSAIAAIAILLVAFSLWLVNERVRVNRRREVERVATERAATDDVREMVRWLEKKSWTQASAALERAKGRLGEGEEGASELRLSLTQGRRDLEMVARLDAIQTEMHSSNERVLTSAPDGAFAEAFLSYGLGRTDEAPAVVASRIKASDIRGALVDALDVWTIPAAKSDRKTWLLEVARQSEHDELAWVVHARDPQARLERKSVDQLCKTAPVRAEIVPLLVSLAADLSRFGGDPIPLLKSAQEAHPGDFWANFYLTYYLILAGRDEESVRFAQAALAIRPAFNAAYINLGSVLARTGKMNEAIVAFRTGKQIDPSSVAAQFDLGYALVQDGRAEEGIAHFNEALRLTPRSALLHFGFGNGLASVARYDEAFAEYQRSIALDPKMREPRMAMRKLLHKLGRRDEAGAAWADHITADPDNGIVWVGFAEYCLFLGRPVDYHRTRRQLFSRFGAAAEFREAEQISRACLLLPGTPEETKQATALIDRAIADEKTGTNRWVYPYFMFTKGLSEYRLDRLESALAIMRGEAAGVLKPGPQLVETMALHRLGRQDEAKKTLESAIRGYDWKDIRLDDREAWMYHGLRREAEELIKASKAAKGEYPKTQVE